MQHVQQAKDDQFQYWNGGAGQAWVDMQPVLDRVLVPFSELLLTGVPESTESVLDIGCGAGDTTFDIAKSLRVRGHVTGIDISRPLIDAAQRRAGQESLPTSFICADAATCPFERDSFDLLISRFGVMFFGDPVQAFTNLRRASKRNAEIRFTAWRDPADNPFMITGERAARPFLPAIPCRTPDAPGQFAFADKNRISSILAQSHWDHIDIQARDVECAFPEAELTRYFTNLGPLGRALEGVAGPRRDQIIATVRHAFDSFVVGDQVKFKGACWLVTARPMN